MTLRELLDRLEGRTPSDGRVAKMLEETSLNVSTFERSNVETQSVRPSCLPSQAGLARWGEIVLNPDRPFIPASMTSRSLP